MRAPQCTRKPAFKISDEMFSGTGFMFGSAPRARLPSYMEKCFRHVLQLWLGLDGVMVIAGERLCVAALREVVSAGSRW